MSAKVKESSLTNKLDIMKITTRDDAISMKDVENGTEITMTAYVIQEIVKDRGVDPSGEIELCRIKDRHNGVELAAAMKPYVPDDSVLKKAIENDENNYKAKYKLAYYYFGGFGGLANNKSRALALSQEALQLARQAGDDAYAMSISTFMNYIKE